jgi:hypothetical protein
VVIVDDTMIASHERLFDRDQVSFDSQHYIPLIERKRGALRNGAPFADLPNPLRLLKRALRRHSNGDRIMTQVLAAVPIAGLDPVLINGQAALVIAPKEVVANDDGRRTTSDGGAVPISKRASVRFGLAPGGVVQVWVLDECLRPVKVARGQAEIEPLGPYLGKSGGRHYPQSEVSKRYVEKYGIPLRELVSNHEFSPPFGGLLLSGDWFKPSIFACQLHKSNLFRG